MVSQNPRLGRIETEADAELYMEFRHLVEQWKEDTMGDSIGLQTLVHPAHLRIIAMGERALPWILSDLEAGGGHWYAALQAISGENPVGREDQGNGKQMRASWLRLGRQRGWVS